jgi:hypothetical protein
LNQLEEDLMATTKGFVGTIEVETRGTARIWLGLTQRKDHDDWIAIAGKRAWFTLNLEAADRPQFMAELSLFKDALRDGLQVQIAHEGAATTFHKREAGDSYEATGVRILRAPMTFS